LIRLYFDSPASRIRVVSESD